MASYTWTVVPVGGTSGVGIQSEHYAYTRALDTRTGDYILRGATWAAGQPAAEVVMRVLKTPTGTYPADPAFGIDYSVFDHAIAGSEARIEAAIRRGLKYLTDAQVITQLFMTVQTSRERAIVDLQFFDPRARQR